jgi:hypothetical protein
MGRGSRNPIKAGDVFGELEIIEPDSGHRDNGHVVARVKSLSCDSRCKYCHGKPLLVRVNNLRSHRIKSCGKVRVALRREYLKEQAARAEAKTHVSGVHWKTGNPLVKPA